MLGAALTLKAAERRELIACLVAHLDEGDSAPFQNATAAEMKRRINAAQADAGVPLSRVMTATRRALRRSAR